MSGLGTSAVRKLLIALLAFAAASAAAEPAPVAQAYLPTEGWRDADDARFHERWFGDQLRAMGEPSLSARDARGRYQRRFRLLVLPTFYPAKAVRIDEMGDGSATLRAVELNGRGGYAPGTLETQSEYELDGREVRRLHRDIAAARLDTLPRMDFPDSVRVDADGSQTLTLCVDGTTLVFELLDASGYHLVTRNCDWGEPLARLARTATRLGRQ